MSKQTCGADCECGECVAARFQSPNYTAGHDRYGHMVMFGGFRSAMPDEKTARQAAAAPELLAACRALVERYGPSSRYDGEQGDEMRAAEAAIAKADGWVIHQDGAEFYNQVGVIVFAYAGRVRDDDMAAAKTARDHFTDWARDNGFRFRWEG